MIKKQFTLYLENKPGTLAKVMKKMADAKINIDGISVAESTHVGLVQMVVSNATLARRILQQAKTPFTAQDVCLLALENTPGALCDVVSRLAKAHVNVNYVYATGSPNRESGQAFVVIGAPDLNAVEAAWGQC
jgi:hypothetical protein